MNYFRCSTCEVTKSEENYSKNRSGNLLKSCMRCRETQKAYRASLKCVHKLNKKLCRQCDGSDLCIHDKYKYHCAECEGLGICSHKRRRGRCNICNIAGCLKESIMSRMRAILGYADFEYLGCTIEEFIAHIEGEFTEGMSFDNYGEWVLDHKRPLGKKGLTEEEIIERLEFTNVQPLWAIENRRKGNKDEL